MRTSGILLHIASLPSPYGIGTLGKQAYAFADFLQRAGQRYWQMLPIGHTGYADSPYQVFSVYAGNPYFIDLDFLIEDGLLEKSDLYGIDWGIIPRKIDYGAVYAHRFNVLRAAYERGKVKLGSELHDFREQQGKWLPDYALFMALKKHFSMVSYIEWDDDIRLREPGAITRYSNLLRDEIDFFVFTQYLFFKQWKEFREYVASKGIRLIGDLPIYVSPDSADVWTHPEYFQLDESGLPTAVAGVPPDYFCATGQLWGNPLYDWDALKRNGYKFWLDRFAAATKQFDCIRIDHFRGFETYWSVPYGEETAINGKWVKGPGLEFIDVLKRNFPYTEVIAEDLGDLTPGLLEFVAATGLPGMKVLQFAFDSRESSNYLPHSYPHNCVCYTGTHDNTTAQGWYEDLIQSDRSYAKAYLGLNDDEGPAWGLIRGGLASAADLFVAQMQDYLELPASCRMNIPSTISGNWQWRLLKGECTDTLADKIGYMTGLFGRRG